MVLMRCADAMGSGPRITEESASVLLLFYAAQGAIAPAVCTSMYCCARDFLLVGQGAKGGGGGGGGRGGAG